MFYREDAGRNTGDEDQLRRQFANEVSIRHFSGIDLRGKTVLDVGCGVSTSLPAFLLQQGAEYQLLDYKQSMVEGMRAALAAEGLPANVCQGDITDLALQDASFDYVHERLVLMHVPNPAIGIRECLRVAKKAVFFVSIDWSTFLWKEEWVGRFYEKYFAFMRSRGSDLAFGGKIGNLLSEVHTIITPYERPWDDHGYIVSDVCGSLAGQLKSDNSDPSLLEFFLQSGERARREGAWVKPALMKVIEVRK